MIDMNCEWVRDRLPERARERLAPGERERLDAHLESCEECRTELELVRTLWASRPRPSGDLAARIQAQLRKGAGSSSGGPSNPWWMAAAAILVLALGTGVVWERAYTGGDAVVLAEDLESDLWPGGETLVAGGLVWDQLSDEELEALLEDFER